MLEGDQPVPKGTLTALGMTIDSWTPCYFLGEHQKLPCILVDLDGQDPKAPFGQWCELRSLLSRVDEPLFMMAGRAWQVAHFNRTHQFCGRCGERMEDVNWEVAMQCHECGHRAYPRVSPVVIMTISQSKQILLAQSRREKGGSYSVLAGFVEAGETLEQAVAREVMEEVGLLVKNIQYAGSQPWPFPHNLMVAFTAEYDGGDISIEPRELADAQWFSVDKLPRLPAPGTIAGRMINDFVAKCAVD